VPLRQRRPSASPLLQAGTFAENVELIRVRLACRFRPYGWLRRADNRLERRPILRACSAGQSPSSSDGGPCLIPGCLGAGAAYQALCLKEHLPLSLGSSVATICRDSLSQERISFPQAHCDSALVTQKRPLVRSASTCEVEASTSKTPGWPPLTH
jgi:hypothetical protein